MIICRPELPQLDLDLVEVEGGGSTPSQFWGRTADGSPVYIRYRGATLTIEKGQPGDPNNAPTMECLLEAGVGPPLHGAILFEQVSDLTGVTLHGQRLSLSEEAWRAARQQDWILDFSGRRTFWERMVRSTRDGTAEFVERLRRRFPGLELLCLWPPGGPPLARVASVDECRFSGMIGLGGDPTRVAALLAASDFQVAEFSDVFTLAISFRNSWTGPDVKQDPQERALAWFRKGIDQDLGWTPSVAPSLLGGFVAEFLTENASAQAVLDHVLGVMDTCYGNRVAQIDMATGETIETVSREVWQCANLRAWCAAAPDRFLGISRGLGPGDTSPWRDRWVGLRPV